MISVVLLGLLALSEVGKSEIAKNVDDPKFLSQAKNLLERFNLEFGEWLNKLTTASWIHDANLTAENRLNFLNVAGQYYDFRREMLRELNNFTWQDIKDYDTRRQFRKLAVRDSTALSKERYSEFQKITSDMLDNWRDNANKKIKKENFVRYVELKNEIAKLNNFTDAADHWLKQYESDDFEQQIETVWYQVRPLYLQMHAYMRRQLRLEFSEDVVTKDGPIPAYLFKMIWRKAYAYKPYPGEDLLPDASDAMLTQGYNATTIFRTADNFFVSLNLTAMPETFWKNSILKKRKNVKMDCHPSASDFFDGKDFRIRHCTGINMEGLTSAHHEMGHVQYFLQYKDRPTVFKDGANPGFHEAVGDTIFMSTSTPSYLKNIGLLDYATRDYEATINELYFYGLGTIAELPSIYKIDKWRWGVFRGNITPDNYNCNWWSIIESLQGVLPPTDSRETDFDPGANYHIAADVEYLRYFVSIILQFQFHKALCIKAGEYDTLNPRIKPLSECNIYGSHEAGNLLKSMLELGSSKPWPDAMEKITGQRKMDGSALLEYFQPLMDWLKQENQKTNEYIGWKPSKKVCPGKDLINGTEHADQ